jgi:hypothetical protein
MLNLRDQERHSITSPEKLAHWQGSISSLYTVRYNNDKILDVPKMWQNERLQLKSILSVLQAIQSPLI